MADIPNRDELERRFGRALGKLSKDQLGRLIKHLGDPPKVENVPLEFWNEVDKEMAGIITPFVENVYLDAARRMLDDLPVGVDWTLVNRRAADWSRVHVGEIIREIDENTRAAVGESVARFFEQGWTMGDLEASLPNIFGPVRSEMIAVTEVTRASVEGERAIAAELRAEGIEMVPVWQTENDEIVRECPICWPRHNQIIEDGEYPPAHPRCLPGDTLVLPIGDIAAGSKRWYEGNIIVIETLENYLTVTPNHPILTPSGWVAAGQLHEGGYVLGYSASEWESSAFEIDNENGISTIKDVFGSLDLDGLRVPTSAPDFHGDGAGSKVAVIRPNREVMGYGQSFLDQPPSQGNLIGRNIVLETTFTPLCPHTKLLELNVTTAGNIVRGFDLASALLGGHTLPLDEFRLGLTTGSDSSFQKSLAESPAIDPGFLGKLVLRFSSNIAPQKIVKVRNKDFAGHVYNLQTETGLYVAAGIITHNCRCWVVHELPKVEK